MTAQAGITGPDMIVYRAVVFLPFVLAVIYARRKSVALMEAERSSVFRFAFFAASTALAYVSSLMFLPVAMAVTIFYTYPLLIVLLSPFTDGIRLSARRWVVAILAFVGVLLAVGPHIDILDGRGVFLAFAGALCCAGMFVTGAKVTTDGLVTFFWSQMFALPLAMFFAWFAGGLAFPSDLFKVAVPFAVTATGFFIGLLFQILASSRLSAASAGLLFLIEPVVAICGSALALGEHVTMIQGAGIILVLGAIIFDLAPMIRVMQREN